MTYGRLTALAIAALIALLLALWAGHAQRPRSENHSTPAQLLLPALRDDINQLRQINIIGAGNQALLTLRLADSVWNVDQRDGWPADKTQLRTLLLSLADARLIQPRTRQTQHHAALGVQDIADPTASGVALELIGPGEPVSLVIGQLDPRQQGTFVRRAEEPQSWLVSTTINVPRRPEDWLASPDIGMPADDVARIQLLRADGNVLIQRDTPEQDFHIGNLPTGHAAVAAPEPLSLAGPLDNLRLQDVVPRRPEPADGVVHVRFTGFDGLELTLQAWRDNGRALVNIDASASQSGADDPAPGNAPRPAGEAGNPANPEQGDAVDIAAARRAARMNAKLATRTLVVLPFQFDALDRSMDSLSTPAPQP